ncbi:hypothetical protein B0H66DRAFT_542179 [Apodospora peruviana]|uniref:Rhodopsin domain-containing protein n=1 Tax=Apodospora peruviana TaxID=516989 RepID=A0AAE0IRK2_9PEZI|nr:hypothetical protein B0H66DRAFT_542179 [Apodospora peruviana]
MLFYALSLTFTRISILLLYKRIFTYNWAKRAIQITLALVIMMGIWFVVAVCTACVPLEAFWNWSLFWTEKVYCQPYQIWWANSALHLAADFAIMALPMPILSTLKLPKRQKYALIGVFALGFFVCIISILRLVALVDITQASPIDSAYSTADLIYWTAVEINASIVCACAMTLKPLIQRLFPRMLSPSRYVNDQSLQWITPISNNRNSRHSFVNRPGASHPRRSASHRSHRSAPSDGGSHSTKFGGGSILPRVEEREHRRRDEYDDYYPTSREELLVGELKSDDIEKQERSDSVLTGAAAASAPRDSTSLDLFFRPTGELTAPPRAHLRLSIHVTKSVHVTKTPSSPVPGEKEEEASGPLPSATFGQRMG